MRNDSSSDVAASESDDEPSVTAVADEPAVTRERAPEIEPGDVLAGRYQIEAVLGKGGSGVVLRAFDRVSATVVAVKVLKPGLTHDPRWEKRFSRELRIGRPIRHANVCRIFDIGDAEGYRFLTMEFATGGTLRDLIKKNQPLRPLAERLADAAGVIAGLAAIHDAGIVHRDVKPDNVLRMADGRLVLSDFGLATDLPDSTMVSVFVGTPHYMAPEVREGDPATTRSDVWSLGVVLHEIFFGKRPERRTSRSVSGVSKPPTTSSTVERAMRALCERCLADDPAERPESATAVQSLFEVAHRSPGSIVRSPGRRLTILVCITVLVAGALTAVGLAKHRRAAIASGTRKPGVLRMVPSGEPADWSKVAASITSISGHVHCFSMLDANTARLIWGNPRVAKDVDLRSGAERPSRLLPNTFAVGCPETSRNASGLLFTAQTPTGAKEVRLSHLEDGADATSITPGAEPLWLRDGEQFVYSIDAAHVAVYSLATMTFALLSDPGLGGRQMARTGAKAVSGGADLIALLFADDKGERAIAVYDTRTLNRRTTLMVPEGYEIQFDPRGETLLVGYELSASFSTLARLDWRAEIFRHVGSYPGFDFVNAQFSGSDAIVLVRKRTSDAWLHERGGRRRLTSDGQNFTAAISPSGDLLLGKRTNDGSLSIWFQPTKGAATQVTPGPNDVEPDFSPDGKSWVYADYRRQSIMTCGTGGSCRVLQKDDLLPSRPRFSPDGKRVAYVAQVSPARLVAVSLSDGATQQLGLAYAECAPVWTSATELWGVEGTPGHYFWSERSLVSGLKTGRRKAVTDGIGRPDELQCWPQGEDPESAFFRRLTVEAEESARLVRISPFL